MRASRPGLFALAVAGGLFGVLFAADATASEPGAGHTREGASGQAANRLAGEASPYLQLHAHNPVDWYPWGEAALARARAESKPIFLSIGYSTCYWCHVMEREVFSNPEIAALMNRHFINIKVDREERPDLDEIYMTATHLLTGSGGWPNSVFLTPTGDPFFAGTYFPPKDARGRPGFPRVLRQIADAWEQDRAGVVKTAQRMARAIASRSQLPKGTPISLDPDALLDQAVTELARAYDRRHGGFSSRTKFPTPARLELLLAAHARRAEPRALAMLTHTLDEMALGGIYDHLAGGFHRYSTEPTWSVPHFEKMLYDNAQLIGLYARAYTATGRPLYRHVVEDVVGYLEREMSHPEGGFYSAQDAEVKGEEGASYVWSEAEIRAALGGERAREFLSVYQLADMHGSPKGVLRLRLPVEPAQKRLGTKDVAATIARFESDRARLFSERDQREQPLRDDKVLAAWNGLAIRALVDASRALDRPDYVRRAEAAAHFVLERLRMPDGRLRRSYISGQAREDAVLDDYAFLADGLLALYAATGNAAWLRQARGLTDHMLADFEDEAGGGFFLTPTGADLIVRPRRVGDQAEPSGNGVALRVLLELAAHTGDARYADSAQRSIAALGGTLERAPSTTATALVAMAISTDAGAPLGALVGPPAPATATATRLPRSQDHVRVSLHRPDLGADRFVVRVQVDGGWHINANPASLAFLVPTSVEVQGGARLTRVHYPPGRPFQPRFSPQALSVYEETVEIPTEIARSDSEPAWVAVRYQACDSLRCLPPGTTRVDLP